MDLKAVKMGLKSNFANVIKSNEIYMKEVFITYKISHFSERCPKVRGQTNRGCKKPEINMYNPT